MYVRRNPWPVTARELDLDPDALQDRARELGRLAPDAFADAAAAPGVRSLRRDLAPRLVDLVADRVDRCLGVRDTGTRGDAAR